MMPQNNTTIVKIDETDALGLQVIIAKGRKIISVFPSRITRDFEDSSSYYTSRFYVVYEDA